MAFFSNHRAKILFRAYALLWTAGLALAFWIPAARATPGVFPAPLDDVYIYFDFARATARGHPLAWSDGNGYSTGATSPTYALLLAVGWAVGFRGASLGIFAAIIALLALVDLCASLAALVRRPRWLRWLVPPALLLVPMLTWSWVSGMEAAFVGALVGRALTSVTRATIPDPELRPGRQRSAGIWIALVAVSRPECIPLALALAVAVGHGARSTSLAASLVRAAAPTVIALALFALLARLATGEWAAAGAVRKLVTANPYASGADRAAVLAQNLVRLRTEGFDAALGGPWAARAFFALGAMSLASRVTRRLGAALLAGAAAAFALVCLNVTAPFQNLRYLVPTWLMLLTASLLGVSAASRWGRAPRLVAGAVLCAALGASALAMPRQIDHFRRASRNIFEQQIEVGKRLAAQVPPPARLFVGDAGAIPYFADRPALDGLGLGGYHDLPFARASVHGVPAVIELIERMPERDRPDVLAIYDAWWPGVGARFGRELFRVRIEDNVICGDPEKAVYTADWSKLEDREALALDLVERIDIADLVDERDHAVRFTTPRGGYVVEAERIDPHGRRTWDAGRILAAGQFLELDARASTGERVATLRLVIDADRGAHATVLHRAHSVDTAVATAENTPPDRWEIVTVELGAPVARGDRLRIEAVGGAVRLFAIGVEKDAAD